MSNLIKLAVTFLTLAVSLSTALARPAINDPIFVGSGAGESEYAVTLMRLNLARILSFCENQNCALSPQGKYLWQELSRRAAKMPTAEFENVTTTQVFVLDPIRNKVTFSQKLLWQDAERTRALDEAAAAGLWLEVLAERSIRLPTSSLSEVKMKIAAILQAKVIKTDLAYQDSNSFGLTIFKSKTGSDLAFIRDTAFNTFEISPLLAPKGECAREPSAVELMSPRWGVPAAAGSELMLQLDIIRRYSCGDHAIRELITVVFVAHKDSDKNYKIDFTNIRVFKQGQ